MAIRSYEIEGLDELMRDLAAFTDDAMPALNDASSTAAGIVLARAQSLVPVLTGNLLIKLKRSKKKLKRGDTITFSTVSFGKVRPMASR